MNTINRDLLVGHDTPDRAFGLRPTLRSQLVQVTNPNDGGYIAIAVGDDGRLRVVIHSGNVEVSDER